jgi:hypothetical protein
MLDYAVNGVAFWSVDDIRARNEQTCRQRGIDPDEQLREFLVALDAKRRSFRFRRRARPRVLSPERC